MDGKEITSNSYMNLVREVKQHYAANGRPVPTDEEITKYLCDNVTIPCFEGREVYRNRFTDPPSMISRGLKSPNWPLLLQPLKLLAKDGDKGLGDIVARLVGPIGGDAYKAWYQKVFGRPCGCSERQETLNEDFPL